MSNDTSNEVNINLATASVYAENLKFSYGDSAGSGRTGTRGIGRKADKVVVDIDKLEIGGTGCHVFLGPNGCGKTTLLKIIAGLLKPDGGLVSVNARAVLVHQSPYLLSGTVFQNVAYGLRVKKTDRAETAERVAAELERWGLTSMQDRPASKLSGGERQRTAIARALVLRPDILLLDEPTASVDPENIIQMEMLIRNVIAAGTTVILSTHHLDFAYRMADSIIRLSRGKQVPAHENIIPGRVTGRDESFNYFEAGGTRLFCPGRDGDFLRAVFSENDVILSREEIHSSARNVLRAEVTGLRAEGNEVTVNLSAGFSFRARISQASALEMAIKPGSVIYALLKSSSIGLY